MKIKVREIVEGCFPRRIEADKSDCMDLYTAEDIELKKGSLGIVSLGVAMELPKGFIAKVYSRSSTPLKLGVGVANSVGIIDNAYCGDNDVWKAPLIAYKNTTIPKGTRICQFEIMPSQFSSLWVKLRWLFCKPRLVRVEKLGNKDRNGIGSTGN